MRFWLGVFFRLIVSIVLAYPLSGVVYWTFEIFKGLPGTLKSPGVDLFLLFFWIIEIPACAALFPRMEAIPMPASICIPGSSPQQQLFSFFSRKGGDGFDAIEIQTETLSMQGA
jgi:hypothetical protein